MMLLKEWWKWFARQNRLNKTLVEPTVDDIPLEDPDRDRIFVDAEYTGPFTGRRAEPAGKLRKLFVVWSALSASFQWPR